MKKRLHLDQPMVMQYLLWLKDTLQGNFGESIQYNTPVVDLIKQRLPVTVTMNLISTIPGVSGGGLPGGIAGVGEAGARRFDVMV